MMKGKTNVIFAAALLGITALFGGTLAMLVFYTPQEATMGSIQKIFYLHLPVAINTFMACLVAFVASVGYLWQRKTKWDHLALAASKVAVLLCSIVLITGMLWGKGAWGAWWSWTPRLTFSLMLWLLYVGNLLIRGSIDSPQRRALVGAVYCVIAFLDVPLVYLSARLIPDPIHPISVELAPAMQLTLAAWFVPVTLATAWLIAMRYRVNCREAAAAEQETSVARPAPIAADSKAWEKLVIQRPAIEPLEAKRS